MVPFSSSLFVKGASNSVFGILTPLATSLEGFVERVLLRQSVALGGIGAGSARPREREALPYLFREINETSSAKLMVCAA